MNLQTAWKPAPEMRDLVAANWPREYRNAMRGVTCIIPMADGSQIKLRAGEPCIEVRTHDVVIGNEPGGAA